MYIFNTESDRKEEFKPYGSPVKMYVCGLTPKNDPHLGHARLFVVNDTIRRYLEYRGYTLHYVQNFTDIDDKIIAAGQREGIPPSQAARRYTDAYFATMQRLGVRPADTFTYVTDYIPKIIKAVTKLIDNGHAYVVDGDVFFSVPSFPEYGRLSKRNEEAMLAGARVELDERKHDPRDFALWKSAKPGEPWWDSPWGPGRPGWHIECSTMAVDELGPQIDIHGGGADLIFPHHENEIAQSESMTGRHPFVRYWVHTGMLSLGEEKMAHSGSFVTIASILDTQKIPAPALRTYLLGQHYRATLIWSDEQLKGSVTRWRRWAQARATLQRLIAWADAGSRPASAEEYEAARDLISSAQSARDAFITGMDDDFNTSAALSALDGLAKRANEYAAGLTGEQAPEPANEAMREALRILLEISSTLGISLESEPTDSAELSAAVRNEIERLIAARIEARASRDWNEADRIRKELDEHYHVVLRDTPQGTTWSLKD